MRAITKVRLGVGIWSIETLITVQFSLIIAAANDLVAGKAPTGVVLFAYSIPSILTRIIVPLVRFPELETNFRIISPLAGRARSSADDREPASLTKEVNYPLRLAVCATCSFVGLQLLALFDNICIRVLGIMLAALSSNLGDMSLQMLCARYPHGSEYAFGGYTAGSGTSALLGASFYTFATSQLQMTSNRAIAVVCIAPIVCLLCYAFILPDPEGTTPSMEEEEKEGIVQLPWQDKLRIIKPMLVPYMLPLATIFFVENSVTQGIFPTLLFYLPIKSESFHFAGAFNHIFTKSREFYPLYLTVNQFSGFAGRFSFWLFRLPGGKTQSTKAYWTLNLVEGGVFILQAANSMSMTSNPVTSPENPEKSVTYGPMGVVFLAGLQGFMAGVVFCNTYWKVMRQPLPPAVYKALDAARATNGLRDRAYRGSMESMEEAIGLLDNPVGVSRVDNGRERNESEETALREFLLSTIAPPDVMAVTIASVFGMALQRGLCRHQNAYGRDLCIAPVG